MVLLAVGEWGRFGKQVITYSKDGPPRTEQLGIKERDAPQRIADYWASVDKVLSGVDDVPWSAAFISWDIASAGVPSGLFCPDQRHTIYVERIVERATKPGAAFVPHEPDAYAPRVGDLICMSRAVLYAGSGADFAAAARQAAIATRALLNDSLPDR